MKNSQKGFLVPLLVVLIAVAIGGGAYYFSQKNKSIAALHSGVGTSTQDTLNITTASKTLVENNGNILKHYSSNQAGIAFDYPANFCLTEKVGYMGELGIVAANTKNCEAATTLTSSTTSTFLINVSPVKDDSISFDDWMKNRDKIDSGFAHAMSNVDAKLLYDQQVTIGGIDAVGFVIQDTKTKIKQRIILFIKDNLYYVIEMSPLDSDTLFKIGESFKFVPITKKIPYVEYHNPSLDSIPQFKQ